MHSVTIAEFICASALLYLKNPFFLMYYQPPLGLTIFVASMKIPKPQRDPLFYCWCRFFCWTQNSPIPANLASELALGIPLFASQMLYSRWLIHLTSFLWVLENWTLILVLAHSVSVSSTEILPFPASWIPYCPLSVIEVVKTVGRHLSHLC